METGRIKNYKDFYLFYLSEHQNKTSRVLHFIGTLLVFVLIIYFFITGKGWLWFIMPIAGYGFAWTGHHFFEKNKPATFTYPFWSLFSDFKLFFEILIGKKSFDASKD